MPACKAWLAGIGVMLSLSAPALAQDREGAPSVSPLSPEATATEPASSIAGMGRALSLDALERYRGGDDSVENHVDIRGQLDGNTAQDIASGNNTVGGDAFANASGLTTVIQNSGSNVLIQNGMIVNVRFAGSGP